MKNEKRTDYKGVYVRDSEGLIDYKILALEEDDEMKLFLYAVGEQWADHVKDTLLFKITDTGNGIKISKKYRALLENGEDNEGVEYHAAEYLRILLNFNNVISHISADYTLIAETDVNI